MGKQRGKQHIIIPVLVAAVILIFYFFNFRIGAYLHPDETAYNMEDLTQMVTEQINEGKQRGDFMCPESQKRISTISMKMSAA